MFANNNNKKLSKVISIKLSIEDCNAFLTLTKLEYEAGLIKEQSPSELLRFTIHGLLNQPHNNRICHHLPRTTTVTRQRPKPSVTDLQQFSLQSSACGTDRH
jgi:hypothetical protein